jgi:hypothetical protein
MNSRGYVVCVLFLAARSVYRLNANTNLPLFPLPLKALQPQIQRKSRSLSLKQFPHYLVVTIFNAGFKPLTLPTPSYHQVSRKISLSPSSVINIHLLSSSNVTLTIITRARWKKNSFTITNFAVKFYPTSLIFHTTFLP